MVSSSFSPMGIYIGGTCEYVKNQIVYLKDYFDMVEHDELESLRQSYEQ